MSPQPGLQPGTSPTGLIVLSYSKMNPVLVLSLCYGGYHTGILILILCGLGLKPGLELFIQQKALTPKLHQKYCLEI